MRVVKLLDQKNHYLEKFYALNESELPNFTKGLFDSAESFYRTRDEILEVIKYLDKQISMLPIHVEEDIPLEVKTYIRRALSIKDEYVNRILMQDLEILTCIESAKSNIIRELQEVRRSRSVMRRYRSCHEGGRRLDEEA